MKLIVITLLLLVGIATGQVIFTVAPAAISATAYYGGSNPTSRIVTMTVSGSSDYMSWSTSNQARWVSLSPSSGSIFISATFTVSFDISNLNVGTFSSIIDVTLEGQTTPKLISVSLTILNADCDQRLTCNDCITSTEECAWCADPSNYTLGSCFSSNDNDQCNSTEWFPTYCPIPCSVPCIHGYCALTHGVCSCDFHYYGDECNVYCNPNTNCSSNGVCNSEGSCSCNSDYYGDSCQYKYCPGTVGDGCSDHGSCNNITGKCTCDANYYGNDCSVYCNSSQCSGHGSCASSGQCACDADYYGTYCNRYCDVALNCTNHGYCSAYGCECYAGYHTYDCSVYCNYQTNCTSHGSCSYNGTCVCDGGYYSEDCALKHCPGYNVSSDVECFGNGYCNGTQGNCVCGENWFSENCSVYCDAEKSCSGHGSCSIEGLCLCKSDYKGERCAEKIDDGNGVVIGVLVTFAAIVVIGALVVVFIKRRKARKGYSIIQ